MRPDIVVLCAAGLLAVAGCVRGDPGMSPALPTDLAAAGFTSGTHAAVAGPFSTQPGAALVTPVYPVAAGMLYRQVREAVAAMPRTTLQRADDGHLIASYLVRSRVFGFRDQVLVQASPAGQDASTLRLYSHSLQGEYDFGVNRRRLRGLIAAVSLRLNVRQARPEALPSDLACLVGHAQGPLILEDSAISWVWAGRQHHSAPSR